MRLFFTLMTALLIAAMPLQLSNAGSKTAASGTIYGKVHDNGRGVPNITVEIMVGNCFSGKVRRRSTNAAGFYRFDGLKVNKRVYVGVNGFRKGRKNALYKASCGKGVKLRSGKLKRHNVRLERSRNLEQRQCAAAGGKWESITRGSIGCNYTYTDGGKMCTDGAQCQSGACLARDRGATSGSCATTTSNRINSCGGTIRNSRWFPKACP